MNRVIKIILLAAAILMAVGWTMYFFKSSVAPPKKMDMDIVYFESARADMQKVLTTETLDSLNPSFAAITHEMVFLHANQLITDDEYKTLITEYLEQHIEHFVAICNECFNGTVWPKSDHDNMLVHLREMEQLNNNKVQIKLNDKTEKNLQQVQQTVNLYHEAVKVASVSTSFEGLSAAEKKIKAANEYMKMKPLNNCKQLMKQLRNIASLLEKAHYQYLKAQVEGMRDYRRRDYDLYTESVGRKLEEYEKNAKRVYGIGVVSDISSLYKKQNYYYNEYLTHY